MKKALGLISLLMVSAAMLCAQSGGGKASATTMEGCLTTAENHYYLTDSSGKQTFLSGEANKLVHLVNHQVQVTGVSTVKTYDTTAAGAASSAVERPVFKVKSVKDVAPSCTK